MRVPGAAVCVSDDTGVVFAKGFGFGDTEKKRSIEPDTIFGIASMSKSITCLAAALLELEGKLSLDDPVCKYLPSFRMPGAPREMVLVRHLCEHRTGLPPLPTLSWSMACNTPVEPWTAELAKTIQKDARSRVERVEDIIDYIANSGDFRPLGAPGDVMSYSNDGYALLSSVIDAAASEPLESYAERRIFEPLGMDRTTFDTEKAKSMGNITSLFTWDKDTLRCSDIWDVAPPYRGCGWIKSTAIDMNRYYLTLSRNGRFHGGQVWPEAAVERMIGRGFEETAQGRYCFGLNKRVFEDVAICEHSGGLTGVSSQGGFIKDGAYAVTVLTNLGGISCAPITNAAFNLWLGLPMETSHSWLRPKNDPLENPALYTGLYQSREGLDEFLAVSLNANGELMGKNAEGEDKLLHCGGNVFTPEGSGKLSPGIVIRFYVRDGHCWAAAFGSRVYQRAE